MTTAGKSHPLAIGGLITLTLIWSYSWIAMKQVTYYIGAFDFTALRCSFGALLLFIVLLLPDTFRLYVSDRLTTNMRHGWIITMGASQRRCR